ncbi:MAG TPA: ChaN family lipoprotein [Limnobacter sp.]|nr:ChaN family lipoprotein [Limnobacter sp.]
MKYALALLLASAQHFAHAQTDAIWLMGEVHDNPQAHQARYARIHARVKEGWRPALVMEQFDREHQALLDEALKQCQNADCLVSKAGMESWRWEYYKPLLQLALDHDLPVLAGNVSRSDANRSIKQGYEAVFEPALIARYKLHEPLPDSLLQIHTNNIVHGHCNILPLNVARAMVSAQVARDVWMAHVVQTQASKGPVVLIAGNGHVDKTAGVPQWLPIDLKNRLTVHGFLEQPSEGVERYDETVLVEPADREDPCVVFKQSIERMKNK